MDRGLASIQAWFLGIRHLSDLLFIRKSPGKIEEVVSPSPMPKNGDKSPFFGFGFPSKSSIVPLVFLPLLKQNALTS